MSLRLREAADRAGVKPKTLHMHALRGKIRSAKVRGRVVIEEGDLSAYMLTQSLLDVISSTAGRPAPEILAALSNVLKEAL